MSDALNGDLTRRATADTAAMQWSPSPSGTVWRKRVHRVGPAESGQVTSVVRYEPGATFPAHDHPEGEEILVLEGTFSDEHGDWPAGTYLLHPEGFRHAPFSRGGCTLLVKLRQYPGTDRYRIALNVHDLDWHAGGRDGVELKPLYGQTGYHDDVRIERWTPGVSGERVEYPDGAELFVLDGSFSDGDGQYTAGSWLRLPVGAAHTPVTDGGCTLYVKRGGLAYLRDADDAN